MTFPPADRVARLVAAALLCALVVAAPLAVGGTRIEARLALSALALATLLCAALAQVLGPQRGMRLPWPLIPPILLTFFYALQLVPLPLGWLEVLSPLAAERRADLAVAGPAPLSLDPAATWAGLALQAGFTATALAAAALHRPRQAWVLRALAVAGAVVALVGLAQWAAGAETIYGLYPLRHRASLTGFFATFVNNNTLAGFEVLAGLVTLGLLARAEDVRARLAAIVGALLCFTAALLAGSRGGHVALGIGLATFAAAAHATRGPEAWRQRARVSAVAALVFASVGIAGALVILPEWNAETLAHLDADGKVTAWQAALPYARSVWLTGSGRDTFALVYPTWQTTLVAGTISHPENHLLQLACEAGLPGLVLGIGGGALAFVRLLPGLSSRGSPTDWGIVAGLAAVGLQQLVDFGLESAGLALPVAAVLGIGVARALRRTEAAPPRRTVTAAGVGTVAAIGLGLLAIGGPGLPGRQADADLARLATTAPAAQAAAAADHPADPQIPLAIAQARATAGAPAAEVLGYINRALARFPAGHQAHLLSARLLVTWGRPAQAALEYRLAAERAPWRDRELAREVAGRLALPRHVQAAVPATPRGWRLLANALTEAGRVADLRVIMEDLALEHPDDPLRRELLGEACRVLGDAPCATAEATWLLDHGHPTPAWSLRALLAADAADAAAAHAALDATGSLEERSPELLTLSARVHGRLGEPALAYTALDQLDRRVAGDPARRAQVLVMRAGIQARHGEPEAALKGLIRALALEPSPATAAAAARQAQRLGRVDEARRLWEDARRRWPRSPLLKAGAEGGAPEEKP
ncbi:MAG: O-antigen ligase family protein [bacterium]